MTLPLAPNSIKFSQIQAEFGGSGSIKLGAEYTKDWTLLAKYEVAGNYVFTVPENVNAIVIYAMGGGGGGGSGGCYRFAGYGGGGGGYGVFTGRGFNVNVGVYFNIFVGAGGAGGQPVTGTSVSGFAGGAGAVTQIYSSAPITEIDGNTKLPIGVATALSLSVAGGAGGGRGYNTVGVGGVTGGTSGSSGKGGSGGAFTGVEATTPTAGGGTTLNSSIHGQSGSRLGVGGAGGQGFNGGGGSGGNGAPGYVYIYAMPTVPNSTPTPQSKSNVNIGSYRGTSLFPSFSPFVTSASSTIGVMSAVGAVNTNGIQFWSDGSVTLTANSTPTKTYNAPGLESTPMNATDFTKWYVGTVPSVGNLFNIKMNLISSGTDFTTKPATEWTPLSSNPVFSSSTTGISQAIVCSFSIARVGSTIPVATTPEITFLSTQLIIDYSIGGGGGGGGGNGCITFDSMIDMFDGTKKPLHQIKVGDRVKSALYPSKYNEVIDIEYQFYTGSLYSPDSNSPFITNEHPIFDWNMNLVSNNPVVSSEKYAWLGKIGQAESVTTQKVEKLFVGNLVLSGDYTYVANGVMIHNILEGGYIPTVIYGLDQCTLDEMCEITNKHFTHKDFTKAGAIGYHALIFPIVKFMYAHRRIGRPIARLMKKLIYNDFCWNLVGKIVTIIGKMKLLIDKNENY